MWTEMRKICLSMIFSWLGASKNFSMPSYLQMDNSKRFEQNFLIDVAELSQILTKISKSRQLSTPNFKFHNKFLQRSKTETTL